MDNSGSNPWLEIPASDYESHMTDTGVMQSFFIEKLFKRALEQYDAESVALLGAATGNGLEHVNNDTTTHLTALDINSEYLDILENRYKDKIDGLSLILADLETCELNESYFSLIFAGLIFEYLDPEKLLKKIGRWLKSCGTLVVILQLPGVKNETVSDSPYISLQLLKPVMNLVRPDRFNAWAQKWGLESVREDTMTLESGKSFYWAAFRKI